MFAVVFVAFFAAHQVADHWIQTQHQADHKGLPGWVGRLACLGHVGTYLLTQAVCAAGALAATGHEVPLLQLGLALSVSGVTHYVADRRVPLRRLADALRKNPAWLEKGGGLYALDQSWHIGFIFIAALMVA